MANCAFFQSGSFLFINALQIMKILVHLDMHKLLYVQSNLGPAFLCKGCLVPFHLT